MDKIIDLIVKGNDLSFWSNPSIEQINVGFTNTLYRINDSYIVKECTDTNNEEKFKKRN